MNGWMGKKPLIEFLTDGRFSMLLNRVKCSHRRFIKANTKSDSCTLPFRNELIVRLIKNKTK